MIVASIDIGTNTVLLLIAKLKNKELIPLKNIYRIPRLGKGLLPNRNISEDKIKLLMQILEEYKEIIDSYKCDDVIVTGTYALRIAANSDSIKEKIKKQFDYSLNIIDGEIEAQLEYLAAISNIKNITGNLGIIDIGGGSTELIFADSEIVKFKKSFAIGSVNGTEKYLSDSPPNKIQIENFRNKLGSVFSEVNIQFTIEEAIAIAGTATTVACMCFGLKEFIENKVESATLNLREIDKLIDHISNLNSSMILEEYGEIVKGREDIILAGTIILSTVIKKLSLESVRISSWGVRHGAILHKYSQKD
jgi:exopolyphosphatase/guanosine-5'-triphosphate,3'-diphosphate pyrophosphatase